MKIRFSLLLVLIVILVSCNALENVTTSGSKLILISLTGRDIQGNEGSTTIFSDVIKKGGIENDNVVAELTTQLLDPEAIAGTSFYQDILVDQIDIVFYRTDGKSVQGVDVPYSFTQPMHQVVGVGDIVELPFVLIRHVAKLESPLVELQGLPSGEMILELIAKVTLYGKDLAGHRVEPAVGYCTVWCSDFADE